MIKEFKRIFQKVNGLEVLKQYFKSGVLHIALIQTSLLGVSRKSLEIVRLSIDNKILSKLRKEFRNYVDKYLSENNKNIYMMNRMQSDKVWICWMQGIENAPHLVKKCYESIESNLSDREVIVITEENYKKYVTLPSYIQEKYDSGIISKTHFSDILRIELLINYGGIWIDSTVLCTSSNIPKYIFDSDLFVYQCLKPGRDGHPISISSWLMSSCTNNPILLLTRSLLYEYWKKYNYMKSYFLLHNFFQIAIESYPEEWEKVIPFSNATPHILLLRLFDKYDSELLEVIKHQSVFHKLTYKFEDDKINLKGTFYEQLFVKEKGSK